MKGFHCIQQLSNIRVTYSGLIAFIVGLISVITGLVFVLIVTRRLSPEEFGTWSLIGSLISYFVISEGIIHFWTVRQVARGEGVGKTAVLSSMFFSFAAIPFYLLIAFYISNTSNAIFSSMLIASFTIPLYFVNKILRAINTGHRPQATSYSLLVFESAKIPAALALVFFLDLGLDGAIISVAIAYLITISVQIYFAKTKLREKFSFVYLKRWIKLSWVSLYQYFSYLILTLDVLLYSVITGSVIGVAFFSASLAIAHIVQHSGLISQALYPKLLSDGSHDHVSENFSLLMYFSIPLLGISIIFSKPGLFALNPVYFEASTIVILLAFKTFFLVIYQTLQKALMGIDKVDLEQNPKYSSLVKSKIFMLSTINYIKASAYICSFVVILVMISNMGLSELEMVTYWALILLVIEVPFLIFMWILVQRNIHFMFPLKSTLKYIGSTLAFIVIFYFTSEYILTYQQSIYDFFPELIAQLAICVGVYLTITYFIDKKAKILITGIIREVITKNKKID